MKQSIKSAEAVVGLSVVGIDVGDGWSYWCGLSSTGEVVQRGRVASTVAAISQQAVEWSGCRVALENGTHSGWLSRELERAGCVVTVANPSRWRGTAHNSKNDANDAESLARVVRVDPRLLYPITHRAEAQQQDLAVVRVRAQLIKTRTLLVNTARGVVKSLGHRLPSADAEYFCRKTWSAVPAGLRPALAPLYASLRSIAGQIARLDRKIAQLSRTRYPATRMLATVPGIGPVTALKRWGSKLASGGRGAQRRALIAIARKLAVLLHPLWSRGESYHPFAQIAA